MPHLVLVRHAEAAIAVLGTLDSARELTDRGRDQAASTARKIASSIRPPVTILCSPKRRACQTAGIIALELDLPAPDTALCLEGNSDPSAIMNALPAARTGTLVLVGHEPDIGRLLAQLIDPAWRGAVPMRPASYAEIEVDAIPPRQPGRLLAFGGP